MNKGHTGYLKDFSDVSVVGETTFDRLGYLDKCYATQRYEFKRLTIKTSLQVKWYRVKASLFYWQWCFLFSGGRIIGTKIK